MNDFYRGYIKTNNKAAAQKFKGVDNLLTLEQAQVLPEYAGVLDDDTILIDLDDAAEAEKLMEIVKAQALACRVYQTTRGMHFLFKDNSFASCATGSTLAIGLHADIKVGTKNSYEVLKFDGKERSVLYDSGDYAAAPCWLHPVKNAPDFSSMGEGDGRNDTLFRYILNLQSNGFTKEEARETLSIINAYIFEMPLDEKELETVCRDEAFPAETFFKAGKFQFDEFGNYLIAQYHAKRINGRICFYFGGAYSPDEQRIRAAMTHELPKLRQTQKKEVLEYIRDVIEDETPEAGAQYVAFRNGLYSLETGALEAFSPDVCVTCRIPHDFVAGAYCAAVDDALNAWSCNDAAIRSLLEEMVGYCLFRENDFQKAFVLIGKKANGKSTFLELLKFALGEQNYSQLDISDLDDRFATASLYGKLANIGDDIGDDFLQGRSVATFKKIVTGNGLSADVKYEHRIDFKPFSKLIFSANTIPKMRDHTGAVIRRLLIIPFNATFTKADKGFQPKLEWTLKSEQAAQYLLQLGIAGLQRLIANGGFTDSQKVNEQVAEYQSENDPVRQFLSEMEDEYIYHEPLPTIHRAYSVFCSENGFRPCSSRRLCADIKEICGANTERRKLRGNVYTFFAK